MKTYDEIRNLEAAISWMEREMTETLDISLRDWRERIPNPEFRAASDEHWRERAREVRDFSDDAAAIHRNLGRYHDRLAHAEEDDEECIEFTEDPPEYAFGIDCWIRKSGKNSESFRIVENPQRFAPYLLKALNNHFMELLLEAAALMTERAAEERARFVADTLCPLERRLDEMQRRHAEENDDKA